ncbi:glutamate receptor ionotropic, kainate 2 [Drosophila bipectinata]|uniref:glutamate receptor ionotropic, kainate 2 n=1 Tax=Drosophila bipectinata TaxID=42026 RepID=UPI001C8A62E3|nr:probable glutamate receptor [Drosophila bipectinata]
MFALRFFLLATLALSSSANEEVLVLRVGAIFFDTEMKLAEAFDAAVEEVNAINPSLKLDAIKHYLTVDDSIVLQEISCDLIGNGVVAIFGPSSKTNSDIVEVLCNTTGIPHLQFDWPPQKSAREGLNHKMTINVAPMELILSTAILDVLASKSFNWNSFTLVYEKSTNLNRLQHILAWKQLHKTGIKIRPFERGDDYRVLWKQISTANEKYVLLDCPPDILVNVINASIGFNMTGAFNHLFLTNLDTHISGIDRFYSKEFTVSIAAIRIRNYIPPPVHDEIDVFDNEVDDMFDSLETQLLYDSVVLFYNALLELSQRSGFYAPQTRCGLGFWQPGPRLVEQMKNISPKQAKPPFKTQKLHINADGQRDDFNLDVYNPIIDRVNYIWNKEFQLVSYEKIRENSSQALKQKRLEDKVDFSQKPVRYKIATRVGEPYFSWRAEPEGVHYEGNDRFEGYVVDLIYDLAQECKFEFDFEPVKDNKYGSYDPITDEWDGIIRALMDNHAQIGICDLTITQARRSVVDFTVPFMQLGISILAYKKPPPEPNEYGFLKPYNLEVWLYVIIAMMISAIALILTGRMDRFEWEKPVENENNELEQENIWHMRNTLWLVLGSILNQGCDLLPRGVPMRLLTAFWWIFALLVSQTYIAKLAAFVTSSKISNDIASLHDLVDQNKVQFGTIRGGATSVYFSDSNDTENRMAWNKMLSFKPDAFTKSNEEGVKRVKVSKGTYAFLMETTSLQYHVQRNLDLIQIGESFGQKHYGIAVPLNSQFRSNLSVGILRLSEKGRLYYFRNKWLNTNDSSSDKGPEPVDDGKLDMESVGGLFVVLIVGVIISFIIGLGEFLRHVQRIALKDKITPKMALKAEVMFLIRFWETKKPRHTYQRSRDSTSTGYSSMEQMSTVSSVKKRKNARKDN